MKVYFFSCLTVLITLFGCATVPQEATVISSPDGSIKLSFYLTDAGEPAYFVMDEEQFIIDSSTLGLTLHDAAPLDENFELVAVDIEESDSYWNTVWGESDTIRDNYREMVVHLKQRTDPERQIRVIFRTYDDGIAFRYGIDYPGPKDTVRIVEEESYFSLIGDHYTWWQPADWDIYEHLYSSSPLSQIDATDQRNSPYLAQTYIPNPHAVNTPVTMRTDGGKYLSFHEAALYDYSGMTLVVDQQTLSLKSELVGGPYPWKVERVGAFTTPWRTVLIADRAGDLIESAMILNLNEPSKIEDTEWIHPFKYVGIWWEMHLRTKSWKYEGGEHGATTAHTEELIDFAADNGFDGVLVEGWNTGWERWIGFEDREGVFDFVTPYPDYDLDHLSGYAREKGVRIIGHHETSSAVTTYEQQMDTAFALFRGHGIDAVKTGYVGKIIPRGHYHHGQWMVNHYQRVIEKAAEYGIMIVAHEPIKDTGIRRTWPNFMSREGVRGMEFNAWSNTNPPDHETEVAFTRMLSGPIDFTPGIFDLKFEEYPEMGQVNTTLAKQLALYVILYSPVQMAADLPANYQERPNVFEFIRAIPADWSESRVLDGEPGDHVTIVRRERTGDRWFLGSITDEHPRSFSYSLDFLDDGDIYTVTAYEDSPGAHWDDDPYPVAIRSWEVSRGDSLMLHLAPGGGAAFSFTKK